MLEKLPKVSNKHINNQNNGMRQLITGGGVTTWLDEQLRFMAKNNPFLYKYVMEHSQKFAMGAVMVGDPQSIAMSHVLEQMMLLTLLDTSMKDDEELQQFDSMMKGWLGKDNLEGLNDVGKKDTTK